MSQEVTTVPAAVEQQAVRELQVRSSVTGTDRESRVKVLAAISDSEALDTLIGKTVEIEHFVTQEVEMPDENTGEVRVVQRTVLILTDGKAYHAMSKGIQSSLRNITTVMGWPGEIEGFWPVKVQVAQEKISGGWRVYTLKVKG